MENQIKLLNSQLSLTGKALKDAQDQFSKNAENQLLTLEELRIKRSVTLSKRNDPEIERDFRRICLLYKESSNFSSELNEAYQEYVRAYNKISSLYLIEIVNKAILIIYDTENERQEKIVLETAERLYDNASITPLPNDELFCYGYGSDSGLILVIGSDYSVHKLPSFGSYYNSSPIYFKRSVYCFGSNHYISYGLSLRYDLDKNRLIQLAPMPQHDFFCTMVIFKGNILISGYVSRGIWLYSIDVDSFSIIPLSFTSERIKMLINAEERLYLIECKNGYMWENEASDEYTWKIIANSIIPSSYFIKDWVYNKGQIYILCKENCTFSSKTNHHYYKFSLDEKVLIKLSKYYED